MNVLIEVVLPSESQTAAPPWNKGYKNHGSDQEVIILDQPGPRGLTGILLDHILHPHLALTETTLADTHPPGHVPLRDDADRQVQHLLDPLGDPFAGVHASALDDVADLVRQRGGVEALRRRVALLVTGARRERAGGIEPASPLGGERLADGRELDLVDGVEQEDGKVDLLVRLLLLLHRGGLLTLLGGGGAGEQRLVGVRADGLHGEKDIRRADRVALAHGLGGPLLGELEPAIGREVFPGVSLRASAAELRALDEALDDAQLPGSVGLAPPGAVSPAGRAVTGSARGAFVAALDDEEVTPFDLRHDPREDGVDERVEGRVADEVVGDVDEQALVGADRGSKSVEDVRERREGSVPEVVA